MIYLLCSSPNFINCHLPWYLCFFILSFYCHFNEVCKVSIDKCIWSIFTMDYRRRELIYKLSSQIICKQITEVRYPFMALSALIDYTLWRNLGFWNLLNLMKKLIKCLNSLEHLFQWHRANCIYLLFLE